MIYIEKGDKVNLPEEHHESHNISVIFYDLLYGLAFEKFSEDLKSTKLSINPEELRKLKKDKIHILDWLKRNQMYDELTIVLSKHILMSVLADFLSFTYESLSNAIKGKMTVAYSLLRKPFIDELLIFERLLVDKKSFVNDFFIDGNPNLYDPSSRKFDKIDTIDQAIAKLKFAEMFSNGTIYKFRYDKSFPGVNGFSNQALHIVTNDPNYKTDQSELNFVFKGPGDIEKYWVHYRTLL